MSRYSNYVMKNNVFAELYAPISSLATTIQLKSGQGTRRGTDFPILATLEAVESGKVIKREIVKITARSGDYLTVVRGFAPCPPNDDSNTQGSTTFSFGADDKINMYVPKEIFDKIGETLNDIYEKGLNKLRVDIVSGLEISVGAGPVLVGSSYYDFAGDTITLTDNSTNYVEIDEDGLLVNNTTSWTLENTKIAKITTSGGSITSIIDRRLATVGGKLGGTDIHELTEKEKIAAKDEFLIADSENIYQNKKITANNLLGIGEGVAAESITKGAFIFAESIKTHDTAYGQFVSVGTSSFAKIAVKMVGNGKPFSSLYLHPAKYGSPTWNLNLRIETDNAGNPSGNLIHSNAYGTITPAQLNTTATTINLSLAGEITIPDGTICHIVLYTTSTSNTNHYRIYGRPTTPKLFKVRQYYNNTWQDRVDYNPYFDCTSLSTNNTTLYSTSSAVNYSFWVNESEKKIIASVRSSYCRVYSYSINSNNVMSSLSNPSSPTPGGGNSNWYMFCGSSDGKKVIVRTSSDTALVSYTLSTARDITTATQVSSVNTYTLSGVNSSIYSVYVSPDGTKLFWSTGSYTIYQANLSTPRDVSTATYIGSKNPSGQTSSTYYIYSMTMSPDGKYLFTGGPQYIREFKLTTAFDITSNISTIGSFYGYNSSSANNYSLGRVNGTLIYANQRTSSSSYLCQAIDIKKFGYECILDITPEGVYNTEYGVAKNTMSLGTYIPMVAMNTATAGEKIKYNLSYNDMLNILVPGKKYYLSSTGGAQTTQNNYELGTAIEYTILKLKQTY